MDSTTRQRVAMLCDELLRRGVPRHAVQPVIDFLDAQSPLRSTYRVVPSGGDGPLAGCHPQRDNAFGMTSEPPVPNGQPGAMCCYTHAPKFLSVMITCPVCHEKRCPRALDCGLECRNR